MAELKVYEVKVDIRRYSVVRFDGTDAERLQLMKLVDSETAIASKWDSIDFVRADPLKSLSRFFGVYVGSGALGVSWHAPNNLLQELFEAAGEMLPITVEGSPARLFRVTRFFDVVDCTQSKGYYAEPGRFVADKVVLKSSAIPSSGFFRVMESYPSIFFCETDSSLSLRKLCEDRKLTGLKFTDIALSK